MTPELLREKFIDWQCQSRMNIFRTLNGRPNETIAPFLLTKQKKEVSRIIVLISEEDPRETTELFKHNFKKTYDPEERHDKLTKFLASEYFMEKENFLDDLFATFQPDNKEITKILKDGTCFLEFNYLNATYLLYCSVFKLDQDEDHWEFVYWHNKNFNAGLAPGVNVIKFIPDWKKSTFKRNSE